MSELTIIFRSPSNTSSFLGIVNRARIEERSFTIGRNLRRLQDDTAIIVGLDGDDKNLSSLVLNEPAFVEVLKEIIAKIDRRETLPTTNLPFVLKVMHWCAHHVLDLRPHAEREAITDSITDSIERDDSKNMDLLDLDVLEILHCVFRPLKDERNRTQAVVWNRLMSRLSWSLFRGEYNETEFDALLTAFAKFPGLGVDVMEAYERRVSRRTEFLLAYPRGKRDEYGVELERLEERAEQLRRRAYEAYGQQYEPIVKTEEE